MATTKKAVDDEIVRILHAIRTTEGERRTMLYRDLAEQMVELRQHYLTPNGKPDWTGRTGAYRLGVRALFADAGYSPAERQAVQTSVRYHIGNIIRATVAHSDLEDLGLDTVTPKERARQRTRAERDELKALLEEARQIVERQRALEAAQQEPPKKGRRRPAQ
jgi:hypothetical protein